MLWVALIDALFSMLQPDSQRGKRKSKSRKPKGGYREGSGRKSMPDHLIKGDTITGRWSQKTRDRVDALRQFIPDLPKKTEWNQKDAGRAPIVRLLLETAIDEIKKNPARFFLVSVDKPVDESILVRVDSRLYSQINELSTQTRSSIYFVFRVLIELGLDILEKQYKIQDNSANELQS